MANFKLNQTGEQIQADLNLLDSNTATSGQVLTANGNGGASWQDASGGSGNYLHIITAETNSSSLNGLTLMLYKNDATPITSFSNLKNITCKCVGIFKGTSTTGKNVIAQASSYQITSMSGGDINYTLSGDSIYNIDDDASVSGYSASYSGYKSSVGGVKLTDFVISTMN